MPKIHVWAAPNPASTSYVVLDAEGEDMFESEARPLIERGLVTTEDPAAKPTPKPAPQPKAMPKPPLKPAGPAVKAAATVHNIAPQAATTEEDKP